MLLAGRTWDGLNFRDQVDVVEAVIVEPFVHGATSGVESFLDALAKGIEAANPDEETWGLSAEARAGLAAAEATFGGPAPKREDAPTIAPDEAAPTDPT